MGHRHLARMAPNAGSLHLTSHTIRPTRPGKPHRPWNARPPSDTGRPVIPTCNNQDSQSTSNGPPPPDQAARKIEANHPLVGDDRPESSRPKGTLARRGRSIGWALLSPAMILLLAMTVGPAIFLIYSSLHNIQMFGG